jgi:hypothetical protein
VQQATHSSSSFAALGMHGRRQLFVEFDQSDDVDRRQGRQLAQQHGLTLPNANVAAATCMDSSHKIFFDVSTVAFEAHVLEPLQTWGTIICSMDSRRK